MTAGNLVGARPRAARRIGRGVPALLCIALVGALAAGAERIVASPAGAPPEPEAPATTTSAPELLERARMARSAWNGMAHDLEQNVAPVARVLRRYRDDPELVNRIAVALVRESRAAGLEPRLLLAVLLVENPWLEPSARSPVWAIGLMQVMPFHAGRWEGCTGDLEEVDTNICYGARIFARYLKSAKGDPEVALLRYNGCVRGTNTPDCHRYPYHVFARAGRASVLAWLPDREPVGRAAAP